MHLKENLFQPPMKELNVAVIGAGFMGKAHSAAYAVMPMFFWPPPTMPIRKVIVDVTDARAEEARQRFGFQESATDWRESVNRSDIDLVDIVTPNDSHAEIAIAAAKARKHIICEKPLARTGDENSAHARCGRASRGNPHDRI
jgi:predicted dehydrogenase